MILHTPSYIIHRVHRKVKQLLCKHEWYPITVRILQPPNYSGHRIIAYTKCYHCNVGRVREHYVSRKSLLNKYSGSRDMDRFSWAIAGALAREIHGKKLTNHQLGWID